MSVCHENAESLIFKRFCCFLGEAAFHYTFNLVDDDDDLKVEQMCVLGILEGWKIVPPS